MKLRNRRTNIAFLISAVFFILLILYSFSSTLVTLLSDYLWFKSLDYTQIFTTQLNTKLGLGGAATLIACSFMLINWTLPAQRARVKSAVKNQPAGDEAQVHAPLRPPPLQLSFAVIALIAGIAIGLNFGKLWQSYLVWRHAQPFNIGDPIFNLDISFYVFDLPWFKALLAHAKTLVAITTVGALLRYALLKKSKAHGATAHISFLGALWLILLGLGWLLERYALLQSNVGVVFGAGYSDIHARMPLYSIEAVLFFIAAAVLIVNIFTRRWKLLLGIGVFWLLLSVFGPLYPAIVQSLAVEPNEFVLEKPYIEQNIHYTRHAYGLDKIKEQNYTAEGSISAADIANNQDVLSNVRLWDYRPLLRTYGQLQEIRLYYTFNEVDIDRYTLDGKLRQVMLSARELNVDELAEQAQTWINRHLIFTHGYGLTLNSVNEVSKEGLPKLLVRDIPPISSAAELSITQPQIYFGELTKEYVIVNNSEDEFDYPQGDNNAYTRYSGPDGVSIGNLFRRAMLALRFNSTQILLSPAISKDSRVLFHRTIIDRAQTLAPMLWLDKDPYPVIADGRIIWILDAYTWTGHYPYSEPINDINYMRNSVKITVDAYSGDINFYLIDPQEPIAATYARIFPDLFQPVEAMPEVLREHWRYPETLFLYQSQLYATYHMRDPQVFYNREDLWDIPQELVETEQQTMVPYYVTMRSPDSDQLEFLIIRPYVPKQKQNMVAWLYADCDGEDYGEIGVFKISKDHLVYGPLQIEARVDQETTISQQLSLWDQRGSRVLRGNLLVIPLNDTFLYVEPLYLEAESGQMPELKRVIVAYADRIAMAETLEEALLQVLGNGDSSTPNATTAGDVETLAAQAWEHYQAAQACLEAGDWTCYGQEQTSLEEILRTMVGE